MFKIGENSVRANKALQHKSVKLKSVLHRCRRPEIRYVTNVASLSSWKVQDFQQLAFIPQVPLILRCTPEYELPAYNKWFIHSNHDSTGTTTEHNGSSELKASFWNSYAHEIVPLEITRYSAEKPEIEFERVNAPLELLLSYLSLTIDRNQTSYSVYLAQHDLRDLPASLQNDLPTPSLVLETGKGDIYSSSLWLGRPPTYTPLHRDPNPNLFLQLAGTKVVRLFRPEVGDAIFEHAARALSKNTNMHGAQSQMKITSASFRGEEMMQGSERAVLHGLVWDDLSETAPNRAIQQHAQDAILRQGDALFIPQRWWHSVRGVGIGVTASANWWFR